MPRKNIPLQAGQKFNSLTIISLHHKEYVKVGNREQLVEFYLCKCDCGKETIVNKYKITSKNSSTKTCGCSHSKHNKAGSRIYRIWVHIKSRCYNKNFHKYPYYGGRGITMCDEWKYSFENFYKWSISNGYADNLSIERIDVNGNYCPENCTWITMQKQAKNKRSNVRIKYNGEEYILADLANVLNLNPKTLYTRYERYGICDKLFGMGLKK